MIDLSKIAARLDADEKLNLTYKFPVSEGKGGVKYETRTSVLLDVAEDREILYVRHDGVPTMVKLEEAVEVVPAD